MLPEVTSPGNLLCSLAVPFRTFPEKRIRFEGSPETFTAGALRPEKRFPEITTSVVPSSTSPVASRSFSLRFS